MAKVLCISSQTVFGPVGNSAAVPALQKAGHEVLQIPTVLLSNHPGLGKPAGQATPPSVIEDIFSALQGVGAFEGLSAVMTGYFTSSAQVIAVTKQISLLKASHQDLHVLVDPVIGDHGRLYVPVEVAEALRELAVPQATIITPNHFELTWLSSVQDIEASVAHLGCAETLLTSLPVGADRLATVLFADEKVERQTVQRLSQVPHGTGDFLAGCYLAERLNHPAATAFHNSMLQVQGVIANSIGGPGLKFS